MDLDHFYIYNFNASRCRNLLKIRQFYEFFDPYDPTFVCIQEINVSSAIKVFSDKYQVFINLEQGSQDEIGIVTLVKKGLIVSDIIIGQNGRIIGLKVLNMQIWNVYPKSGSAFKKDREVFFREILCNLFMNWKDSTKYIFEAGDHNCIHRHSDSLNNSVQHMQPGFIKHIQIQGLQDDFLKVHGLNAIMYSRITQISKTRIDYILSNTNKCSYFQYIDMNLGLDHSAVLARYDIQLSLRKEFICKKRFFSGWVISKCLEKDDLFLDKCKLIFRTIKLELETNQNESLDPSFFWLKMKSSVISLAKLREKQLRFMEHQKGEVLKGFYSSVLKDISQGIDCFQELENIKREMDLFYKERSKLKVDKMKSLEIDDYVYDIHKLQNQRKYENQKKINEIQIGNELFSGTTNVVEAIENKMRKELEAHDEGDFNAPPSQSEDDFLSKLTKVHLSEEEKRVLTSQTNEDEISYILAQEVEKDSSPGEDGITYRFMAVFWESPDYRFLYLKFLNFTRKDGSWGLLENFGVMSIKNKKGQSNLYEKKRKLTKVNKESNLGNGKVWTNRFKKVIIPKILPKTQFNCQNDVNIIDELMEIRSVNKFLMGESNLQQENGTILSIDFKDAFRSVSHRWFDLVMKKIEVPQCFLDWFWMMYKDLYVIIVLNRYKSNKIYVKRGFMEGHPPSMAAFVVSLVPLMYCLEEKLLGIRTPDQKCHKYKFFADDLKLFLNNMEELVSIYDVVCNFEKISGLEMHRDPTREKCQALPFGSHRGYQRWPAWISVKNKIKIVGGIFSNNESFESINSELVSKCFYDALHKAYGMRGTIFQKAYYVNTYLFSKLWFTAQFCKIDEKMLKKILSKALAFIYAGENEKPVHSLNFRNTLKGGLGLTHPGTKAKALLLRSMYRELLSLNGNIYDPDKIESLYGHKNDFIYIIENGLSTSPAKAIYDCLIEQVTHRNDSLIPSRNEKRAINIKWGVVFKNLKFLRGVNAEERCFAWKLTQDMLPVGSRIHRRNAERRCLAQLDNGGLCQEIQNLEHVFRSCSAVMESYAMIIQVLDRFIERSVSYENLVHLSFNHRNKMKLKCALWFAVKILFLIFIKKYFNKIQLLRECIKEIDWNLNMSRNIGSIVEMIRLKDIMLEFVEGNAV